MTRYEVTTILADESAANPAVAAIQAAGGTITHEETLGKRRFAYPIKGELSGVYHRVRFDAEPSAVTGIDQALHHDGSVLRYLLVTQPREVKVATPEVDDAAIEALGDVTSMNREAEATNQKTVVAAEEPAAEPETAEETLAEPTEEEAVTVTSETGKNESVVDEDVRQAALDEKLKNILGK